MAGTSTFPEVAFVEIPDNDKSNFVRRSSIEIVMSTPEGNAQHAEGEMADHDATVATSKLSESVRWLGRVASDAISVPHWLQEWLGLRAPERQPSLRPVAWHRHMNRLAVADDIDRVHICDASAVASTSGRPATPAALPCKLSLYHDFQQQVTALAWRPLAGNVLAVGCRRGLCLWSLGKCPAGGSPACRATVGGSSAPAWLSFLRTRGNGAAPFLTTPSLPQTPSRFASAPSKALERRLQSGPVSALAWSPNGQLLAASSQDAPGFLIFDVTTGAQTAVQADLAAVSLMEWSPDGCYLLTGCTDGSFRIWETQKWTSAAWNTLGKKEPLAGAAWTPEGRAVVVAHRGDRQLAALHFTRPAPGLDAQLFPLPLPKLSATAGDDTAHLARCSAEEKDAGPSVAAFAWEAEGERLAVALDENEPQPGGRRRIAIFATTHKPMLAVQHLGFAARSSAQPGPSGDGGADCNDGELAANASNDAREERTVLTFRRGALLAVQQGLTAPASIYACSQYLP